MNEIDLSLKIACQAHQGVLDRSGVPYILHPITVGMMGETDEERCAGFLHDVVEDTKWTCEDLLKEGIPVGIANAVQLLTHDKTISYQQYLDQIIESGNPIALKVKFNDLTHNYSRSNEYPELQAKYAPALKLFKKVIEERSQTGLYKVNDTSCTAIFAGGCFWGVQHQFEKEKGVLRTLVGYTGGTEKAPTYAQVRKHETKHVEAVIIEFDSTIISYERLCQIFFEIHDPAQTDGVGPDIGPQYRSEIFYLTENQKTIAQNVINDLRNRGYEVNTLLREAQNFWVGEEYHQNYYQKTGGEPYCHLRQKKF